MRFNFDDKKLYAHGKELDRSLQAVGHAHPDFFRRLDRDFLHQGTAADDEQALAGPVQGLFVVSAHALLAGRYANALKASGFSELINETYDTALAECAMTISTGKLAIAQALESGGLPEDWPVVGTTSGLSGYIG